MKTARVFKFESLATADGDGIRGVVFFSGCPLKCEYCHNPENAIIGETYTSEQLFKKIIRFKSYYKNGGVTFSGGEPLLHGEFILELGTMLKNAGINLALDTSGSYIDDFTPEVINLMDLIILDIKFPTEQEYQRYVGGSLARTLDFLEMVKDKRIWLRTVILNDINDSEEVMDKYYNLVKNYNYEKYELLPFHTLGFSKYEQYHIENKLKDAKAMDNVRCKELEKYLASLRQKN